MTNIFHKKDGLADAVKSVMEVNQFHREAEAQVNEMFGVVSRKALPHEQQASWDAEFNKIISEGAMKRMSMGDDGGMETYKKKPEGMKPKGMKMADKDYDGDGKIETSTDEWKGSRDKAIKKSMAMDEEQIDELNLSGVKPSANIEDRRTKGSRMDRPVSNQVTKSDQMKTPAMSKSDRLEEKKLTDAEMAKREEIVKSMKKKASGFEKRYPGRGKEVMYATATKQAKELAEESLDSIQEEIATNLYAELNYVMEQHGEEAGDEWIANLSEEQLAIMEAMSLQDFMDRPASKNYMAKDPERSNRAVRGTNAINNNAQAQRGMAQARAGSTDAARQRREADMAQKAREQGANKIRKTGPGFEQLRRNQPQDNTKTAPLAQTPRGYEGGGPAQKVDAKTMKSTASSPVQQAAKKALSAPRPAAPATKAPAPVKKAKPAAPKPTFKANFKGGFGQRATQDTGPQRRGSDR